MVNNMIMLFVVVIKIWQLSSFFYSLSGWEALLAEIGVSKFACVTRGQDMGRGRGFTSSLTPVGESTPVFPTITHICHTGIYVKFFGSPKI